MKNLIEELIYLNLAMIKNGEVNDEYADQIITIKNEYERRQEEIRYLNNKYKWG